MWISSFVVALPDDADAVARIAEALVAVAAFELGTPQGRRLPVVLECEDPATARAWHEWVEALPGVVSVDVAFVSFEQEHTEQPLSVGPPG